MEELDNKKKNIGFSFYKNDIYFCLPIVLVGFISEFRYKMCMI